MVEPLVTAPTPRCAPGNLPIARIVIHATAPDVGFPSASRAGRAAATARYFQGANAGGSAHYVVDVATEVHCVADDRIAWHAPPNAHSIGIEICAEASYTYAQWLHDDVWPAVERAAVLAAELCARFDVPLAKLSPAALLAGARGICGHADVSQAWHQSTHTDPGPEFPWPEFLKAVQRAAQGGDDEMEWSDKLPDLYPGKQGQQIDAGTQLAFACARAAQALDAITALTRRLEAEGVI